MPEMLMPKLSDTMEEGTILRWIKADGDKVAKGEPLVEIETDKATMTVEAPGDGTLVIIAEEGDTLDVGAPIATIGDAAGAPTGVQPVAPAGEADPISTDEVATGIPTASDGTADTISGAGTPAITPSPAPMAPQPAAAPPAVAPPATSGDRVAASPLARNIAAHAGLDLSTVTGTGPGG